MRRILQKEKIGYQQDGGEGEEVDTAGVWGISLQSLRNEEVEGPLYSGMGVATLSLQRFL
jgi:hypothetical protein